MIIAELLEKMTRYQHKIEVYSLLGDTLSEFVHSDTDFGEEGHKELIVDNCLVPTISQEAFDAVLCEVFRLKKIAEDRLCTLENTEVVYEAEKGEKVKVGNKSKKEMGEGSEHG